MSVEGGERIAMGPNLFELCVPGCLRAQALMPFDGVFFQGPAANTARAVKIYGGRD